MDENVPRWIHSDAGRLKQILINLISNAISFCDDGDAVRVWARKRENRVLIVVEDTGPGIPEDQFERILAPFYRIDDARVDGDIASITTCLYDDIVLTMDGSIFDESTMSAITEWTMVRSANGWRWSDWRVIDSTREGDLCGFAG